MTTPVGELPLEAKTNYFIGNDPAAWHTDVPNFARVRYTDVYPGVDLIYYGNRGGLEYDFVVAPGANPDVVAMDWEGAESVEVDDTGALVMKVEGGELRQASPVVYQDGDDGRNSVAGAFEVIGAGRVGVRLGAYDPAKPLVIDPVLVYSTYLGGRLEDNIRAIAVDTAGAAVVTGYTNSANFPTMLPYDSTYSIGGWDVFVTKLSPAGTSLEYSTYLGGSGSAQAYGIALDSSGAAYVTGETNSDNFPTVRAYDSTFNGGFADVFLAKLTRAGNGLDYSTYLGGSLQDEALGIALDAEGNAYLTGQTSSPNFPTVHPFIATMQGGIFDGFVAKLRMNYRMLYPTLVLDFSTYLGGNDYDHANDIAVDNSGAVYVVGSTESSDFPVFRATYPAIYGLDDAFVSKLTSDGSRLLYSSYLGGGQRDEILGVALTQDGAIYVAGTTYSSDYPTTQRSFDPTYNGSQDAFVTKLRPGSFFGPLYNLDYSMYLGASYYDFGSDIAVTSAGNAYVVGQTVNTDFPTLNAYDATFNGNYDVFVTKLSVDGASLVYSTYLGGSNSIDRCAVALDSTGAAYVAGVTDSTTFPTTGAYDSTYNGGNLDGFIAKLQ